MLAAPAELLGQTPDFEQRQHFHRQAQIERQALPAEERCLTEVDNLNRYRLPDGRHAEWALEQLLINLVPYVKEGGMPDAVHTAYHPYEETGEIDEQGDKLKSYMYLGRTAVQNAQSGYQFHIHDSATRRVEVEIDEAIDHETNLRPGIKKVFISPRMSRADASLEVAESEHLADDDAVRVTGAITDEYGNITARAVQSLLVEDIPLEAWVAMMEDPQNIFGKSIKINNPESALSVMKAHTELEVSEDLLPEGPVSIVEAVLPYIKDLQLQTSVRDQVKRFRENQVEMNDRAVNIAMRWRDFEVELADSLDKKQASDQIQSFIDGMRQQWSPQAKAVIASHRLNAGGYKMTRQLAVLIEKAKQNTLLVRAAVVSGNKKVLKQLSKQEADSIYRAEITLQVAHDSGMHAHRMALESQLDQQIASKRIKAGGGCAGLSEGDFSGDGLGGIDGGGAEGSGSWHGGKVYKNSKCQSCKKVKSEVGACHICKDCVHNPSKREREFRQYLIDKARKGHVSGYLLSVSVNEIQPRLNRNPDKPKKVRNLDPGQKQGTTTMKFKVATKP